MAEPEKDAGVWRAVYGVAVVTVIVLFFVSLQDLLSPFLLFLLLVPLLSPFAGTRTHLLLLGVAGLLTVLWLLETTGFLLAPFFLSLAFAYILHPLVRKIQGERVSRTAAIALLVLPLLALLGVAVMVGVPALSREIAQFIERFPTFVRSGITWAEGVQRELARRDLPYLDEDELLRRIRGIQPEAVIEYVRARQTELARSVWAAILGAGRGLGSVLTVLGYVFLTPILTFYLLRDYEPILERLAKLVPVGRRGRVVDFAREYDRLLSRFLRGQLVAAAITGTLTGLGLWAVGFPYALLLGVVAGVFNVVPYLGLIVSLIPALFIALFSGAVLLSLGKLALVFGVVQALDSAVVGPRIVGESVGLHPVWVILALAVAGFFWGFVGLLLAVPLAVLVKLLLAVALERYQRSRLYLGADA